MVSKISSGIPSCLVSAIATQYVGGNDQELDVEKDKELAGDAVELDSLFRFPLGATLGGGESSLTALFKFLSLLAFRMIK